MAIDFNSLSYDDKMHQLWFAATYLMTRLDGDYKINLYHLNNGQYVELFYNTKDCVIENAIAVNDKNITDKYVDSIELHNFNINL